MDKRVCLITGASSGIGKGIALSMAGKAGCKKLAIVARRMEKLEETAEECKKAGATDVLVLPKDLSDMEACAQAVQETVDHFGRIDVLVNNAAIFRDSHVADMSPEVFKELLHMNVVSPQAMSKEAMLHLRKAQGNVVFISSIAGLSVGETLGGYCASKAALTHLAKAMALEEAPNGVRVNVISPGAIVTDMFHTAVEAMTGQKMSVAQVDKHAATFQPLERAGLPVDIGEAVVYLANNDVAGFVSGTDFVIDGGCVIKGLASSKNKVSGKS